MKHPPMLMKKSGPLLRKPGSKLLSYAQTKAIKYLVAGFTEDEVSEKLDIKKGTLRGWRKNPKYIEKFEKDMEKKASYDNGKRKTDTQFITQNLNNAIKEKIIDGDLDNMNIAKLMTYSLKFADEVRADSEGGGKNAPKTNNITQNIVNVLSEKHKQTNSSTYLKRLESGGAIIDITPAKPDDEVFVTKEPEEKKNGQKNTADETEE